MNNHSMHLLRPNIYRIYRNLPCTYANLNRPIICLSHFLTVENDDIVCVLVYSYICICQYIIPIFVFFN